jgi:CHAT domain-containing protein
MSRAFLAAGARAVVASLWAIDDDATLSFMVSLYTYLKMGESASKSLQKAIKEIRAEGYDEPRYWAPFFVIGDDITIKF